MFHLFFIVLLFLETCSSATFPLNPATQRKRTRGSFEDSNEVTILLPICVPCLQSATEGRSPKTVTFIDSLPSTPTPMISNLNLNGKFVAKKSDFHALPDHILKFIASFLELPWQGWTHLNRYAKDIVFPAFAPLPELTERFGFPLAQDLSAPEKLWLSQNRLPRTEKEVVALTFTFAWEKHLPGLESAFLEYLFAKMKESDSLRDLLLTTTHPFEGRSSAELLLKLLWKRADFERILMLWDWFGPLLRPASLAEVENFGIVEFIIKNRPVDVIFGYFAFFSVNDMFTVVAEATRFVWSLPLIDDFLIRSNAPVTDWLHFGAVPGELCVALEAIKTDKAIENFEALRAFRMALRQRFEDQQLTEHVLHIYRFVFCMISLRLHSAVDYGFALLPWNDFDYVILIQILILSALQAQNEATFLFLVTEFIKNFPGAEFLSVELREALLARPSFVDLMLRDEFIRATLPFLFAHNFNVDAIKHRELFLTVADVSEASHLWLRPDLISSFVEFGVRHLRSNRDFYNFLKNFTWRAESIAFLCRKIFELKPSLLGVLQVVLMEGELRTGDGFPTLSISFLQVQSVLEFAPFLPVFFDLHFEADEEALKVIERLDEFDDDQLACLKTFNWPTERLLPRIPHHLTLRKFVKKLLKDSLLSALQSSMAPFEHGLDNSAKLEAFLRLFGSILAYLRGEDLGAYLILVPTEVLLEDFLYKVLLKY